MGLDPGGVSKRRDGVSESEKSTVDRYTLFDMLALAAVRFN